MGFPKILGTFLGVPPNKDYRIFGSSFRSPYLGKLPNVWVRLWDVGLEYTKGISITLPTSSVISKAFPSCTDLNLICSFYRAGISRGSNRKT